MVFIFDKCVKIIYVMPISCNEFLILTQVIEEGLEFDGHMLRVKILLKILRNHFKEWANNSLELIFMIKKIQNIINFY